MKCTSWRTTAKSLSLILVIVAFIVMFCQWNYLRKVLPAKLNSGKNRASKSSPKNVDQKILLRNLKLLLVRRLNTTKGTLKSKGKKICSKGWQEKYKKLHKEILESKRSPKYLVFECGGIGYGCGGYGNRMGAITSLLYLAVLTNRALLIDWKANISITDYFLPKNINWEVSATKLQELESRRHFWGKGFHKRVSMETLRFPGYYFQDFNTWFQKTNMVKFFSHAVEYVSSQWYFLSPMRTNKYFGKTATEIAPKRRGHKYSMIGCAFDFLFKRTPRFENLLNQARKFIDWKPGVPRIGIHFRAGDYSFRNRKSKSMFSALERFFKCAARLERLLKKIDPSLDTSLIQWFLATDNKQVRKYATDNYPKKVTYLKIKIEHISMAEPSRGGIEGVLLDNVLLSECDVLIFSNSTFSHTSLGIGFHSLKLSSVGEKCKY